MIYMSKLRLTNLQQEILRLLFIKTGISLNQRLISKSLGVSQPAVMKALPKLEEEELIKISQDKESKRWSIELNRTPRAIHLKRADNLKMIYESGLADYLGKEFAGATIILFGSYSRGEDIFNSDIDLTVIGRKEKHIALEKYEKDFEKKIKINFFLSFKDIHKHLKEGILNGIILSGGVEL